MINRIKEISEKIINLFSNEEVTAISARDFLAITLNEWQYINEDRIRYKIIEKTKNHVVAITEWLEDDIFHKHYHNDANETILVLSGKINSDGLEREAFGKVSFKKGTIHVR